MSFFLVFIVLVSLVHLSFCSDKDDAEFHLEANVTVGTGELKFEYNPMGARVRAEIEIVDAGDEGKYYVTLRGEGNEIISCGRDCTEEVPISETCTNIKGEDFETEFTCDMKGQPDDDWIFYLSLRCENDDCKKMVLIRLKLTRKSWEGYGYKILDIMIYTGVLLGIDVGALLVCLCGSCYVVSCCLVPLGILVSVIKGDTEAVCCVIVGIPVMFAIYATVVCGSDCVLFTCVLSIVTVIMTLMYWCPYCC